MNTWQQLLQQLGVIGQSGDAGHPGRLIASLAIFIVGLIVLEIIFHLAKRRVQAPIAKKGQDPRQWRLKGFMLPLRLAAVALLLRLIEPLLPLTPQFIKVLHSIEVLFIDFSSHLYSFCCSASNQHFSDSNDIYAQILGRKNPYANGIGGCDLAGPHFAGCIGAYSR